MANRRLRLITGWALLVGAGGIFIDAWASWSLNSDSPEWLVSIVTPGSGDGSIGLIPAYLGVTAGMIGFVIVLYRIAGLWPALLCGIGVLSMFVFWYSYPARAAVGGLGGIIIGTALLTLPSWGRVASPVWVAAGALGIPELVRPGVRWGPIAAFTLVGDPSALTAAFVLWGVTTDTEKTRSPHTSAQPAP